jgi:hypothetical protein
MTDTPLIYIFATQVKWSFGNENYGAQPAATDNASALPLSAFKVPSSACLTRNVGQNKMASPKNSHLPEFYVYVFKVNGIPFYVGIGRDKRASDRVRYIEYLIRREKEGRPLKKGLSSRVMMALLKEGLSITFDYLCSDVTREYALKKEKEEISLLCSQGFCLLNIHYNPHPPKSDLEFLSQMKLKLQTTEPNQSLQTMTFAVTPAASHPSRQRRSCLI